MIEIFSDLMEIIIRIFIATTMSVIIVRLSPILFNFNPIEEVKKGNLAGGVVLAGLALIPALIVGLFHL